MADSSQTRIFRKFDSQFTQVSRPHTELRLRTQCHLGLVVFASSPSPQGFSFPPALNVYIGHQLARTNFTLEAKGRSTVAQPAKTTVTTTKL